jgi:2-C-methyl-D-erythritol 4-phosphate cytidylyltransferase
MSSYNGDRSSRSVAVVILAAGRGERFAGAAPKALETIAGRSLLAHTLDHVAAVPDISQIVVAAPPTHMPDAQAICAEFATLGITVVAGGKERQDSVALALAALNPAIDIVIVHDAARSFAPPEVFERVIAAVASGHVAVVPGVPVVDTIKDVDVDGRVRQTVPRASLRAIQTPQGFSRDALVATHDEIGGVSSERELQAPSTPIPTDDAGMMEAVGYDVWVVTGHPDAFKITTPFDRLIAHALVTQREVLK